VITYRVNGKKIKEDRVSKGLSQEEVADALGMVQQAYSRIETNVTKKVDIEILVKLGVLFGRDYNEYIVKAESRVNQRIKVGDNNQGDCYNVYKSPRKISKRMQEVEKELVEVRGQLVESQRRESELLDEILLLKEQLAKGKK